ncbi:GNAT family N-acetyltransferase [Kitasatospora herbaricolor]|uniref:GNAT family N-acetyltransferase n=1 Tax=Kitasatospora herbaricolor TaxID=68217 RepID=A0ABZ1WFX0_9ACTN|nr:GNAT family N-acetyltransferase [Kitasatospora herbaricolor]
MTDRLTVRPYTPADEDTAVRIWARAARLAHPFLADEGTGARERKMREVYLVLADHWIAELDGVPVGVLGLLGAEIGGLFVAPEAQGRGVGRALVGQAALLHGALTLEVYEKNTAARRFYARVGFTEQSRRPDEEYDEVLLKLARPAP